MEGEILIDDPAEPPGTADVIEKEEVRRLIDGILPVNISKSGIKGKRRPQEKFITGSRTIAFREKFYPTVLDFEWNDWRWQLKNKLTTLSQIEKIIHLSDDEREAIINRGKVPLSITPYYASLIDRQDCNHPIRKTVIPVSDEFYTSDEESADPLTEERQSPVPGLVHRYSDRVLFLVSNLCSVYCRYCTRSRIISNGKRNEFGLEYWKCAIQYIEENPSIRDVLISGGDPLTLPDDKLEWLLGSLRRIPHVEFLRIGTKVPLVLPQRITSRLLKILKRYQPLWMSLHVTHPEELTPEVNQACCRLADAGVPLGSQTVLLSGINDNVETMKKLFHGLLKIRVRPYYLYQCDPIPGTSHFRTPVNKGIEIIKSLRGHTTGYAVPQFMIDAPGGGGKVPINPDYLIGRDCNDLLLLNYLGKVYRYPDSFGE